MVNMPLVGKKIMIIFFSVTAVVYIKILKEGVNTTNFINGSLLPQSPYSKLFIFI